MEEGVNLSDMFSTIILAIVNKELFNCFALEMSTLRIDGRIDQRQNTST